MVVSPVVYLLTSQLGYAAGTSITGLNEHDRKWMDGRMDGRFNISPSGFECMQLKHIQQISFSTRLIAIQYIFGSRKGQLSVYFSLIIQKFINFYTCAS